uniref:Helitron helicase-like domain-containing protein n=1 Tax=Parascaris univalens TaxID=6257 RepID=A0A915BUA7_PARUN
LPGLNQKLFIKNSKWPTIYLSLNPACVTFMDDFFACSWDKDIALLIHQFLERFEGFRIREALKTLYKRELTFKTVE